MLDVSESSAEFTNVALIYIGSGDYYTFNVL